GPRPHLPPAHADAPVTADRTGPVVAPAGLALGRVLLTVTGCGAGRILRRIAGEPVLGGHACAGDVDAPEAVVLPAHDVPGAGEEVRPGDAEPDRRVAGPVDAQHREEEVRVLDRHVALPMHPGVQRR